MTNAAPTPRRGSSSPERRSALRADCDLDALLMRGDAETPVHVRLFSIGEGGVGLKIPVAVELSAACRIRLEDDKALADLSAHVVWCRQSSTDKTFPHSCGLAFGALSNDAGEALRSLVENSLAVEISRFKETTEGLHRVGRFLDSFQDLHQLLEQVMDEAKRITNAEASSLLLWDARTEQLYFDVVLGEQTNGVSTVRLKLGEGIAGHAALADRPVNVADVRQDTRWSGLADSRSGFQTRSILATSMKRHDRLVGVIEVLNRRSGGPFTAYEEANLVTLASQAAVVIENARLHQEILQVERLAAVGKAVSELAHCVKNILNGILGGQYLLDEALKNDDRSGVNRAWDIVKRNTTFLSELTLDMLSYAKEREPHYKETDVNDLVKTIAQLLTGRAQGRGVSVQTDADRSIKSACIDPTAIYRVLLNLGTNAIEACAENTGVVTLGTRSRGDDWLAIHVEDNGSGIDEEHRDRLFKEFFSTKGSKGTGLGLAVSDKIVREHGGRIEVASEKGKGTRFDVFLPKEGVKRL